MDKPNVIVTIKVGDAEKEVEGMLYMKQVPYLKIFFSETEHEIPLDDLEEAGVLKITTGKIETEAVQ